MTYTDGRNCKSWRRVARYIRCYLSQDLEPERGMTLEQIRHHFGESFLWAMLNLNFAFRDLWRAMWRNRPWPVSKILT